jgi:hypothetical protein
MKLNFLFEKIQDVKKSRKVKIMRTQIKLTNENNNNQI